MVKRAREGQRDNNNNREKWVMMRVKSEREGKRVINRVRERERVTSNKRQRDAEERKRG